MREERIEMSERERERLKVLHEVEEGHLTQVAAARRLRLTDRHVRRLLVRLRTDGDGALVHGLRGRASNRKISKTIEQRSLHRLRRPDYAGFGPTLAAEHLARRGIRVSRETLRNWMSAAGLWRPRRQRLKSVHVWRPRRSAFGELVMMDSSPFRWLEERGPACHLIAMIDDATSRVWGRFAAHDSSEENLCTLQGWLERYGRPRALYTDKNGLFVTSRPVQWQEQLRDEPARTQFGRALAELDIEWIAAHSPQAKGRIERLFGTLQDRLVKEMRIAAIATLEDANRFLEMHFLAFLGTALRGDTGAEQRRASASGAHASTGADSQCARGTDGRFRSHREMARSALGSSARRRFARACAAPARRSNAGSTGATGCVSADRYLPLAPLPGRGRDRQVLPAYGLQDLPMQNRNPKPKSKPSHPASRSPVAKSLEADISIWRKTGHFYFALTKGVRERLALLQLFPCEVILRTRKQREDQQGEDMAVRHRRP